MPFFFGNNFFREEAAILDSRGNQIFRALTITTINVSESKQYPQHTIETGAVISDHTILQQNRLSVVAIIEPDQYTTTYKLIRQSFLQDDQFIVQTKTDTYTNLYIESLPHEESAQINNTIVININFLEQQFVDAQNLTLSAENVENPADADAATRGGVLPTFDDNADTFNSIFERYF